MIKEILHPTKHQLQTELQRYKFESRQVCQIRARHGSHPELHTTQQVSDVMGMTRLCIGTAQTQSVGVARQALRHASLGFVSVQTGTAQS